VLTHGDDPLSQRHDPTTLRLQSLGTARRMFQTLEPRAEFILFVFQLHQRIGHLLEAAVASWCPS
jgi:hypothetical protein